MKKWGILGLVVLGGLILGLQYYIKKGEKTATVTQPQPRPEDQVGVALPAAATGYVPLESSYDTAAGSYNNLFLPTNQSVYPGACPGGSLADIMAAHGKTWGYFVPKANVAFEFKDSEVMYKFVGDYAGCVAASRSDISACDVLPGELNADEAKIPLDLSLYTRCRQKAGPRLFYAYLAGVTKGRDACNAAVAGFSQRLLSTVNLPEFCEAAAKGMDPAREFLSKTLTKQKHRDSLKKWLPASKESCGGDAECLHHLSLYNAVKEGKASSCPRAEACYCEALISRTALPCDAVVKDMSKAYCAVVERIKKKSGGFIGVSPGEIQAHIAQEKARKADADLRKSEDEKTLAEVNKKAKQILGKE